MDQVQWVSFDITWSYMLKILSRFPENFCSPSDPVRLIKECGIYCIHRISLLRIRIIFSCDSIPSIHRISLPMIKIQFFPQDIIPRAWIDVTFYNFKFPILFVTKKISKHRKRYRAPCARLKKIEVKSRILTFPNLF